MLEGLLQGKQAEWSLAGKVESIAFRLQRIPSAFDGSGTTYLATGDCLTEGHREVRPTNSLVALIAMIHWYINLSPLDWGLTKIRVFPSLIITPLAVHMVGPVTDAQ